MVQLPRARAAALAIGLAAALATPEAHAAQPRTWNFDQVRVTAAQATGRYGQGVTVAVIDTWVDRGHPNFGGRVLPGVDCVGGCSTAKTYARDRCEHGTHVAGTVASASYGVAPKATVLPLRVLAWDAGDEECNGSSADVASAIRYAMARNASVVNLSLGAQVPLVSQDSDMAQAVREAADAGVLVVFAAGNADLPVADSYGDDALIVAATNRSGALASYSQHGVGVDLAAPGGDAPGGTCTIRDCVISTWPTEPGDGEPYAAMAGTSMAAPHVSGLAALLLAQRPGRGLADLVNRMRTTARPLSGAGAGVVDATAALGAAPAPKATAPSAPRASTPPARPVAPATAGASRGPAAPPAAKPTAPRPATTPEAATGVTVTLPGALAALPVPPPAPPGPLPVTLAAALAAAVGSGVVLTYSGSRSRGA